MLGERVQKVTGNHLKRHAYLSVRQAVLAPSYKNSEDLERQYVLRQRAIALGWPNDRIRLMDCDYGGPAGRNAGCTGFESLAAGVVEGRAGIEMELDVSRFPRRDCDWWRLVEVCLLAERVILDQVAVYDPRDPEDRLLLGLKGTMPQFEVSGVRSRRWRGLVRFIES